jgi:hypothetical protein
MLDQKTKKLPMLVRAAGWLAVVDGDGGSFSLE